jgi:hypothetical protein
MREFIGSALVVVLVSGTLAVPLALVVARLAMNPPDVAAFVRRLLSLEPMRGGGSACRPGHRCWVVTACGVGRDHSSIAFVSEGGEKRRSRIPLRWTCSD